MGGEPRQSPRDQPLEVRVEGGRLVISIGIDTLAFAVENAPEPPLTRFDPRADDPFIHTKVTDPDAFAVEVARALTADAEDGATAVTALLDAAAVKAIEDGCEGVDHGGEG